MQRQNSRGSASSAGDSERTSATGASSAFSSAQGSETSERLPGGDSGGDNPAELLNQQGNIQEAVFGVLYTLSKERLSEGWKFVVSAMIVDYLQLAVFFIGNNFAWNFDFYAWYWKWLSWICFTNMFPSGTGLINGNYKLYLCIFSFLTGFLVISAALCIFVGFSFKRNTFPYVWPIKALKLAVSFFFELFYISTLGIFLVSMDCTYYNPVRVNEKFRNVECFEMPHLMTAAVSIATSLLAMSMAYFIAVANSELSPINEELSGQARNRSALKRYALISLITIINELFPSCTQIQGIAGIIILTYLTYNYVRYVPFQTWWINGLQASFFASLTWASLLIVLMAFFYQGGNHPTLTIVLWTGLLGVIPLVWTMLYFRVRHAHKVALKYRLALKTNTPVIHKFWDELEVEVVARCRRIRDQWGDLVPAWVDTAEAVFKAGLLQFPESAFLHIAYSSFLIHQRGAMQPFKFMWAVARDGDVLDDGLLRNVENFVAEGSSKMVPITIIQVLAMVLSVVMSVYFYWYMLRPFLISAKKESRRVAELLSQLPPEMDVENFVLSVSNMAEEKEEAAVKAEKADKQREGGGGGMLAGCWGLRKAKVSPVPVLASGAGKGPLSIVISNNTSKDKEVPPAAVPALGNKYTAYHEKLRRHHSEAASDMEDPTLWNSPGRSPRKVSFAFPDKK